MTQILTFILNTYFLGFKNPETFAPSKNFISERENIEEKMVFKFLRRMPKGSVLHSHFTAIGSKDFLMDQLNEKNLYICQENNKMSFKFFKDKIASEKSNECTDWKLLEEVRKNNPNIDNDIEKHIVMLRGDPKVMSTNINVVWTAFQKIFGVIKGLIMYR